MTKTKKKALLPKVATAKEWEALCLSYVKQLHAEEKKRAKLAQVIRRAVELLKDGSDLTATALLEDTYRCPKYSHAWNVRCEYDAGHDGHCCNGGDGFNGYIPTFED